MARADHTLPARKWELSSATLLLPAYLDDRTQYEFPSPQHPIRSIAGCRVDMPPSLASAWVQDRRERVKGMGLFTVGPSDHFHNATLEVQGFGSSEKTSNPETTTYYLVVSRADYLITMWVTVKPSAVGLVHALVERFEAESMSQPPVTSGWDWVRLHGLWVPVPAPAIHSHQYQFSGAGIQLAIMPPSVNVESDPDEPGMTRVAHQAFRSQTDEGATADWQTWQLADSDGHLLFVARGSVTSEAGAVALRSHAGASAAATLNSDWEKIVLNVELRRGGA